MARKEKGAVRKAQIARAAVEVIGREGIRGFTTAKVARRVGISEANLYRHFKNKDAILKVVLDDVSEKILGFAQKVVDEERSPLEKLEDIIKFHIGYIEENSGILRIVFSSETLSVGGVQKKLFTFITRYMEILSGVLKKAIDEGRIRKGIDPEMAVSVLLGTIQFTALMWLMSGFKFSLSRRGEKVWEEYRKTIEA